MKKVTLFLVLLIVTTFAKAQISLIPKAGVNISTVSYKNDDDIGKKSLIGFTAGLGLNFNLTGDGFISLQPELLYSQKGVALDGNFFGVPYKGDYRLNYLELPVLLKIGFGTDQITAYVNAGPSFGYLLGGHVKGNISVINVDEKLEFTETPSALKIEELDANRLEIGANFGGGIGYNFGENSNLFFDVRYNLGLTDYDNNNQSRNRVIALTAGVQIPF